LIQQIGYDRICEELKTVELDSWREYTLLQIDVRVDMVPIHLLKMTCPSTNRIHVLRVLLTSLLHVKLFAGQIGMLTRKLLQ
jgi:hypothetical protein